MLLETRQSVVTKPDTDLTELGYDNIDGMNLPVTSILSTQGNNMILFNDMLKQNYNYTYDSE